METKTIRTLLAAGLMLFMIGVIAITSPGAAHAPAKTIPAPAQLEPVAPTVTVIDNTQGSWGDSLAVAVKAWDRSPRVRFQMSPVPVPGTYNVYVQAYDHERSGWCGLASQLDPATMHIQLNTSTKDRCPDTPDYRTMVAAHELGHALGIPHPGKHAPKGVSGVSAGTMENDPAVTPTGADFAVMREAERTATYGVFALARMGH